MELELSVHHVVLQRTFLFIDPVDSARLGQSLLAVVTDEHVLLQDAAHVLDRLLVIYPVERFVVRSEDLAGGRGYQKIGFDVAHH